MLNEALDPLGIKITQTHQQFYYMMTFTNLASFKLLFQKYFLNHPIHSSKKSEKNSPFILTFAFDDIPQDYCDNELVDLMTSCFEEMGLKLLTISDIGLNHVVFSDLDAFMVMVFGLIQNLFQKH